MSATRRATVRNRQHNERPMPKRPDQGTRIRGTVDDRMIAALAELGLAK